MSKKCSKCQEIKELDQFHNLKSNADGKKCTCKQCIKKDTTKYYLDNKESILSRKNKEEERKRSAKFYKENKSEILKKMSESYFNDRNKFIERGKKHYEKNKSNILERQKNQKREKRRLDPKMRTIDNLRRRTNSAMKEKGWAKSSRTREILGIDYCGLISYIESKLTEEMTMDKLGKEIHIDHIVPLDSATTEEELIKLCHYTNLQPLWAKDNLTKSNKIIKTNS